MRDIQIRLNLKDKVTGKETETYPPIAAEANGLNRWPVNDNWEIVSVDRNSGINIPDIRGYEWEAYEGDVISIMGEVTKDFEVIFHNGMFGIEVNQDTWITDFVNTFESRVLINNKIREYHQSQFAIQKGLGREGVFFIPLAHLNIGGTINGMDAILINNK